MQQMRNIVQIMCRLVAWGIRLLKMQKSRDCCFNYKRSRLREGNFKRGSARIGPLL